MKQRNTGLHVGKYREQPNFKTNLATTILPRGADLLRPRGPISLPQGRPASCRSLPQDSSALPCSQRQSTSAKRQFYCQPRS